MGGQVNGTIERCWHCFSVGMVLDDQDKEPMIDKKSHLDGNQLMEPRLVTCHIDRVVFLSTFIGDFPPKHISNTSHHYHLKE